MTEFMDAYAIDEKYELRLSPIWSKAESPVSFSC
jgi:hypothetical protein